MELKETKGIPTTEFSQEFVQGMLDRMGVSFCKYGAVAEGYPHRVNALDSLRLRLERYATTGNTEYLMDVANFAMIEFMYPAHKEAHFKSTDSDGSPGRVRIGGSVNAERNTEDQKMRNRLYKRDGD